MFSDIDRSMMQEALLLAARGMHTTHPNPRVGCVVVQDGAIVGRGFHACAGGPHAEIEALADAGAQARGATVYVTLEPCCHAGRTGPCTDALIDAEVARVIYAHDDPSPLVAGQGGRRLREAGMQAQGGLLREAARALNPGYLQRMEKGRPFMRSKIAVSLDGRTALSSGESKWITGEEARAEVQQWRGRSSAILTGIGTVLADDPGMDLRLDEPGSAQVQPARVILDSALRMPGTAKILGRGGPVHLLTASAEQGPEGVTVHRLARTASGLDLAAVMDVLASLEFNEMLVEAGPTLNGALLKAGLVDELVIYMAPHLLGDDARGLAHIGKLSRMQARMEFEINDVTRVGRDLRLVLRPMNAGAGG